MIALRLLAVVAVSCLFACSDDVDGTTPTCDDQATYDNAAKALFAGNGGAGGAVVTSTTFDTADKPAAGDCFTKPGHAATLVTGDDASAGGSAGAKAGSGGANAGDDGSGDDAAGGSGDDAAGGSGDDAGAGGS